eukprot:m.134679 g.134679  ORF g.134679 m.134679 type:complete len:83 (-) comp9673_c0_seq1:769-1017(-)
MLTPFLWFYCVWVHAWKRVFKQNCPRTIVRCTCTYASFALLNQELSIDCLQMCLVFEKFHYHDQSNQSSSSKPFFMAVRNLH